MDTSRTSENMVIVDMALYRQFEQTVLAMKTYPKALSQVFLSFSLWIEHLEIFWLVVSSSPMSRNVRVSERTSLRDSDLEFRIS